MMFVSWGTWTVGGVMYSFNVRSWCLAVPLCVDVALFGADRSGRGCPGLLTLQDKADTGVACTTIVMILPVGNFWCEAVPCRCTRSTGWGGNTGRPGDQAEDRRGSGRG
ncbi:hypothetical protein CITRIK5_30615 [Citricoccus sp. K5]|nr:hypothetical protein CITRIK5_30615 [Citricoccus sp. K5]